MDNTFKQIDKVRFWCQKVLPLAYDDSISYYEFLCKVCDTLNMVIEDLNAIPDFIRELVSDERLKEILSELLDELREQIASANENISKTATANRKIGDFVWLNGLLYKVTHDMIAGDQYVENSNCVKITIEEELKTSISSLNTAIIEEIANRKNSDNELTNKITEETANRVNQYNNISAKINKEIEDRSNLISSEEAGVTTIHDTLQYSTPSIIDGLESVGAIGLNNKEYRIPTVSGVKKYLMYTSAYIEVYGGKRNAPTFDNKEAYERAIADGVTEIKFQAGTYYFSDIKLHGGISLNGDGMYSTIIKPLSTSNAPNFIYLDKGPVAYAHYSNFCIEGNGIANQNGIGLIGIAQEASPNDGGLWWGEFESVFVRSFNGMALYAYNSGSQMLPNQFCTFINCQFTTDVDADCAYLNGVNQFVFVGCRFSAPRANTHYIFHINGECCLDKCTIEGGTNGIGTVGETYLTIINPWIEGVSNVIKQLDLSAYTQTINIIGGDVRGNSAYKPNIFVELISRINVTVLGLTFLGDRYAKMVKYGEGEEQYAKFDSCAGGIPANFSTNDVTTAISNNAISLKSGTRPITLINGGELSSIRTDDSANFCWGNVKIPVSISGAPITVTETGNIVSSRTTIPDGATVLLEYVPDVKKWLMY